jgi:hypothetical protein
MRGFNARVSANYRRDGGETKRAAPVGDQRQSLFSKGKNKL